MQHTGQRCAWATYNHTGEHACSSIEAGFGSLVESLCNALLRYTNVSLTHLKAKRTSPPLGLPPLFLSWVLACRAHGGTVHALQGLYDFIA
jgi:hypothetical protein